MKDQLSRKLFERAKAALPGGVNSPVRSFKAVGGSPVFIVRAKGSWLYDADGNGYIDYMASWGPLILGHSHPKIVKALQAAVSGGTSFGTPTPAEVELAEQIKKAFPGIEMIRMVNSGTEATMSAIRLSRGYTGRDLVIKFAGCYHGHADGLLVKAGSGATTLGSPDSAGIPEDYARNTLVVPYNDLESIKKTVQTYPGKIAAIIMEPIAGNMGVIPPKEGFLEGVRQVCDENNIVLIFDEVISGFRVALGGAQEFYGVKPDITCLGKIIGGGLPVGAYGGKREIMEKIAPLGPVYQAGTLSGNPLAMKAGLETVKVLSEPGFYDRLENPLAVELYEGMKSCFKNAGLKVISNRVGSMWTHFFTEVKEVFDYESALKSDTETYSKFFHGMLEEGVYLAPSQFEASFFSAVHSQEDVDRTLEAAEKVCRNL